MAKRVFGTVALLSFMLFTPAVQAEESSVPVNLLGFLKPGMCVGMHSVEGDAKLRIDVYTQEQSQIARELMTSGRPRAVPAQQIVDTHPAFQKTLDTFMETLRKESPEANPDRVFVYPYFRSGTWHGTISAIGNDYVLIDREGETKRRCVLAKSAIVRIDLDAEPVYMRYSPTRK